MYLGDFFFYIPTFILYPGWIERHCSESATGAWGTAGAAVWSTRVALLPSPASSGSSSRVDEAQLPKTSTTTQTSCFYSTKLIFRGVVEVLRILRCSVRYTIDNLVWTAKQTGILDKHKYIHPGQYLQAEKTCSQGKLQIWIRCMVSAVYKMILQ